MTWHYESITKKVPKFKDSILIVGLPGIGNVGKIAADFIIDETDAKPIYNIFSHALPHSVFVNDDHVIELPTIELYAKVRRGKSDILVLTGDVQPSTEQATYELCESILDKANEFGIKYIVTLGGVGLAQVPKKPKVYVTGNSKKTITEYAKGTKMDKKIYGLVGPIIGVSGLMVGLAGKRNLPSVCMLAETLGYPTYLGMQGAREIVNILNAKFKLGIKISDLDKEIENIESEILIKSQENPNLSKKEALKKIQALADKETRYIG